MVVVVVVVVVVTAQTTRTAEWRTIRPAVFVTRASDGHGTGNEEEEEE